ncbi:hypothetical protein BK703_16705 [Bacillus thuringiensis serovar silo]|uniref:hypothetical protein n=1 Tax=Bacillus thuringiensis TaxID=1428 RepID=UPI000A3B9AE6|nr:hypothetical protein [Bacillus thuringiensis]MDA2128712.1 hypothetical protein [Bacillus cereus]MED3275432.1 hypothetical protein [Bacillus thuringiensis]OTW55278.1 hypothetical protein BK703_16705 [Bacillus thuringiensis serovar silo]OTW74290.1 hypothetical protein BK700_01340 [Bacillus thuringiensis serovar toguchini]
MFQEFESFLNNEGIDYDAITEHCGESFYINGDTYEITVLVDEIDESFDCHTTHKERYRVENGKMYGDYRKAIGNKKSFKKISAAKNYVTKWFDK